MGTGEDVKRLESDIIKIEDRVIKLENKMTLVYEWFRDTKNLLWVVLGGIVVAILINMYNTNVRNDEIIKAIQALDKTQTK